MSDTIVINFPTLDILHYHPNTLINHDIIKFINYYGTKQFDQLSVLIETVHTKTKAFYSDEMYETLWRLIDAVLRIKKFVGKHYKRITSSIKYINTLSLELVPFNENMTELNINNNMYKFDTRNLIKLYKYNLYIVNEHYYLSGSLSQIKNPYTNIPFTLKEHVILFEHIKDFYFKIKKVMPKYLYDFKNNYFNINLYQINNNPKILFHSVGNYLLNLDKDNLKTEFLNLIHSSTFLKKRYCSICFKKINIKKLFLNSIRLYILNSNSIYKYGMYEQEFIHICNINQIKLELKHHISHRRIIKSRVRRRRDINHISPDINIHPLIY